MVRSDEETLAREAHRDFCEEWKLSLPLHSSEIRSQNEGFLFLREMEPEKRSAFYECLYSLMRNAPVRGIACVIDRPGYNARYLDLYEQKPWMLCKTAFNVVVERAAKHAKAAGLKLRVYPERCNKDEDLKLTGYYNSLRTAGLPFDRDTSGKYAPLTQVELAETLYEFRLKRKTSPMAQFADLFLWPMCIGGYHQSNQAYARLIADGKLIDCSLSQGDCSILGIKYSCFEKVTRKP